MPSISSFVNQNEFSINQLPEQEISIPIRVTTGITGTHQLTFENATTFSSSACLILEDLFTGTKYDLKATPNFSTTIYDTTTVARFLLHIGASFDVSITDASCANINDGKIVFSKNTTTSYDIIWKDATSSILANKTGVLTADSLMNLTDGTYYIETTDALCGNVVDTVTLSSPTVITSLFNTVSDTINVGAAFTPINTSTNATSYLWDFGDGNTSALVNPNHTFGFPGIYVVSLKANQSSACFNSYSKTITVQNALVGTNQLNEDKIKTWVSKDRLSIILDGQKFKALEVTSILGQSIYNRTINRDLINVNLSQYSAGIYILNLSDNNGNISSFKIAYQK